MTAIKVLVIYQLLNGGTDTDITVHRFSNEPTFLELVERVYSTERCQQYMSLGFKITSINIINSIV